MYRCESWKKKGWVLKNWCLQTMVWEKTLERPWDSKIKLGNYKGNQHWIFTEWTDAKTPILWPPDEKSQIIGKDLDAGKDWRQKEMGMTEYEMVGWHHRLNGHEFEQTPGNSEGQRSLVCFSPWGHKESDTTEQLNNKWTGVEFSVTLHDPRNATALNVIRIFLMNYILLKRLSWFLLKAFFFFGIKMFLFTTLKRN